MTHVIRAASVEDIPTIVSHRFYGGASELVRAAYSRWLATAMATGSYHGAVAIPGSASSGPLPGCKPVGGCGLVLMDWGPTRQDVGSMRGRVVNMYVDPDLRKQGLGTALLLEVLQQASQLGVNSIGLSASSDAAQLYRRAGFQYAEAEMIFRPASLPTNQE